MSRRKRGNGKTVQLPAKLREMLNRAREVGNTPVIMVAMAMYAKPNPKTVMDLVGMMSHFHMLGHRYQLWPRFQTGTIAASARQNACVAALDNPDCEAVLFIDDDMHFNYGTVKTGKGDEAHSFNPIERLLARDKDIIGTIATTRGFPIRLNAAKEAPNGMGLYLEDEDVALGKHGPFKTDFLGFGMILIRRRALEKMERFLGSRHFFTNESNWRHDDDAEAEVARVLDAYRDGKLDGPRAVEEMMDTVERLWRRNYQHFEDYSFCKKARAAGLEIWVDPTMEIHHIGDYDYSVYDWIAARQQAAEIEKEQADIARVIAAGD